MKKLLCSLLLIATLVLPNVSFSAPIPVFGLGGTVGDDLIIGSPARITLNAGTNDDGITFGSLGTATKGIDLSGSGLASADNWLYMGANDLWSAGGFLRISAGIQIKPSGGIGVINFNTASNDTILSFNATINQFLFALGSNHGRQMVFGDYAYRNDDYDHATPTNPTLFVQSATDPDSDNTEWISLSHDQTDGVIDVGSGGIRTESHIYIPETTTPTAIGSYGAIYPKADNNLYFQDGAGVEHLIGGVIGKFKSYSHSTGSAATHYIGGYYNAPVADANLTNASTTVNLGTADISYAAHAFAVSGSVGSTDGSDCVVTVSGTSITDAGARNDSDSEVVIADCTTESTDDYSETSKKWIGQITYTLSSSGGSTFSHDFNYGFAKYEDFANTDATITSFECVGMGGANDSGFNLSLLQHDAVGWTYHASAFVPGNGAIVDMNTDHNTEIDIGNGIQFAYKRTGLSTAIDSDTAEGVIIRIITGQANSIGHMDCHVGYTQ